MSEKSIDVTRGSQMAPYREETRMKENYLRPAVDIFETEESLMLVADLPGVEKNDLIVDIDKNVLALRGEAKVEVKGEGLRREFALASYFRSFELPDEIDYEKIAAELKDGVLTLAMPKSEAAKPRRIAVTTH